MMTLLSLTKFFTPEMSDENRKNVLKAAQNLPTAKIKARAKAIKRHKKLLLPTGLNGDEQTEVICDLLRTSSHQTSQSIATFLRLGHQTGFIRDLTPENTGWVGAMVIKIPPQEVAHRIEMIEKHKLFLFGDDIASDNRALLMQSVLGLSREDFDVYMQTIMAHDTSLFTEEMDMDDRSKILVPLLMNHTVFETVMPHIAKIFANNTMDIGLRWRVMKNLVYFNNDQHGALRERLETEAWEYEEGPIRARRILGF